MNKLLFILCTILYITIPVQVSGQKANNIKELLADTSLKEKIELITDRSIYTVEESIFFKADYSIVANTQDKNWSAVLYIELIYPNGTPIVQAKYPLSSEGSEGEIFIPKSLYTGIYYLKAYTKWMRNYSTKEYAYCKLKLINPKSSKLESIQTDRCEDSTKITDKTKSTSNLNISIDQEKYASRKKVNVRLGFNSDTGKQEEVYTISVVKSGAKTTYPVNFNDIPETKTNKNDSIIYYPEINGITISGKVLNHESGNPEHGAVVQISPLNYQSYFSGVITNQDGEFFFSFPELKSSQDFFIKAQHNGQDLKVNIDPDFCNKQIYLCPSDFTLSETEKSIANEISINAQLTKLYKEQAYINDTIEDRPKLSFYGYPNRVIYTKDYIDLPYLEEFIFELFPEFIITRKKNIPSIQTKERNTFSVFPVLILIDNIPITDLSAFFKTRTHSYERIEIVDEAYILGDLRYNGIINAITKEHDMAGIELPQNSMFFNYQMYEYDSEYRANQEFFNHIPDRRNCLYWNPNFIMKEQVENSFSFYTPDAKGKYEIIIQSVSDKNKKTEIKKEFIVE